VVYIYHTKHTERDMKFNEFVKNLRIENRISLREFCRRSGFDPSNWSKIERGVSLPPKSSEQLDKIGFALDLEKGSDQFQTLFELAAIASIPKDIVQEDVLEKLPVFFRTLRGDAPTEDELRKLINTLNDARE